MNIQIINFTESNKLKDLDKNLSIPLPLFYKQDKNKNGSENNITNFTCDKKNCCIDKTLYNNLINNIKLNKFEKNKFSRKMTKRTNKNYKSTRKTSKNTNKNRSK